MLLYLKSNFKINCWLYLIRINNEAMDYQESQSRRKIIDHLLKLMISISKTRPNPYNKLHGGYFLI